MSAEPDAPPTLLATLSGADRPGVTSRLFAAVEDLDVTVLDVEQVVVRGQLTLGVLMAADEHSSTVAARLAKTAYDLGLSVTTSLGSADPGRNRTGRAAVVLLGHPLTASAISAATSTIAGGGANIDRIRRLSRYPVTTLELDVSGADVSALRRDLARVAAHVGVDIAVSPAGLIRRGRRLVVMDVDSTLIQDEVIELLAAHAGREAEVRAVTEAAMAGELDFAESLRERVAVLEGLPATVLDAVTKAVRLTPGARTLVRTLHRLGFTVALVSGGFTPIVEAIAGDLGISRVRANDLEIVDAHLTGRVSGPIVDRAGKAAALREFAAAEGLPLSRTVAIGDGANDLDMLQAAGLGVAFNAKPLVRSQAHTSVNVPYLDTVLFLLGISRDEIEEADTLDGSAHPEDSTQLDDSTDDGLLEIDTLTTPTSDVGGTSPR
ncbi:MAG: phosphoserine phosphatase SerB [Actinomycetia bacterium]|nr:phosphoserine phosphatase SerB [Actinomycetes bacterium]